MMKQLVLTISLFLSFGSKCFACDCGSISKYEDMIASDVIFIGEVIDVDRLAFKIKIYEFLKNEASDTLIAKIDDCSIFPEKGEIWLVFASYSGGHQLYASQCGSSRSFNMPLSLNTTGISEPPPQRTDDGVLELVNEQIMNRGLSELYYDIITLRQLKLSQHQNKLEADLHAATNRITTLIYFLIGCLVVLIFPTVVFLIRRLKSARRFE